MEITVSAEPKDFLSKEKTSPLELQDRSVNGQMPRANASLQLTRMTLNGSSN